MTDEAGFKSATELTWLDVSDEVCRTYHYRDGAKYTVMNPLKLNVKQKSNGDSHRVQAKDGVGHYIAPGWIALSWIVHTGKDTVAF
jgi:hypothetical protein